MGKSKQSLSMESAAFIKKVRSRFNRSLLRWGERNRRNYPWRSPVVSTYQVLIAEVLLKRTTATAAERIYTKFLKIYPDINALVSAKLADLERLLSAVGLQNQRAKGLKEIAFHIRDKENGNIPNDLNRLLSIPHIGSYAARAVLSFGYGIPAAGVDSNVVRVLRCVFIGTIPEKAGMDVYQEVVDILLPRRRHKEFNWAILDMGALVCRYERPLSAVCPLRTFCASSPVIRR